MKSAKRNNNLLTAVVANQNGEIFDLPGYAAVGMANESLVPQTVAATHNLPYGSELMLLPDRHPILFDRRQGRFETLINNPYRPEEKLYPVAAFNAPGYVITYISAYKEITGANFLPLFSYGAVGWHKGKFRSSVICVDREKRQDIRQMKPNKVLEAIHQKRRQMPSNRLRAHLEKCALTYGCPAAKNFFLGRYEAPLPTSKLCNARCLGCISLQRNTKIPCSQERIDFLPSPQEIAEIALAHITRVKNAVVSFGQGCEGEPLLASDVIQPAIRKIRSVTRHGTINLNTNGSRPGLLKILFKAGLDSIRISINSVRPKYYHAYFQPRDYGFADVVNSLAVALQYKKFVALNYLNIPGFTDTPEELNVLTGFIQQYPINMIQWRNLNYDPVHYWDTMKKEGKLGRPVGMENMLNKLMQLFPTMRYGYFNPPKEKFFD